MPPHAVRLMFGSLIKLCVGGAALSAALGLSSCSMLPASAPTGMMIESNGAATIDDYVLVPVTPDVAQLVGREREKGFPASMRLAGYTANNALRPGDVIAISIFELGPSSAFQSASSGGASSSSSVSSSPSSSGGSPSTPMPSPAPVQAPQAKTTTLPPLTVESNGTVRIPFVGAVAVEGLSPSQAAKRLESALRGSAVNPQVLVSLVQNVNNVATVGGEANRVAPVALSLRGERLLDVLGQAGGSKWPAFDTDVRVVRGASVATVKLQRIVDDPNQNIRVRPNDQIFLVHNPKTFAVLGAAQKVSQYTFDTPTVSLAEAFGRGGGPVDTTGSPAAVYLFRQEPREVVADLAARGAVLAPDGLRPAPEGFAPEKPWANVVYHLDLNQAQGYVMAQNFLVHDKDVLLVGNAEGAQLLKALTIARGFSGLANDLAGAINPTQTIATTYSVR